MRCLDSLDDGERESGRETKWSPWTKSTFGGGLSVLGGSAGERRTWRRDVHLLVRGHGGWDVTLFTYTRAIKYLKT